ncbi:MAG: methyltransferase [Crocinitomicaceae bacterium]|nr:methyltransferase [Crocinitomicaceae bacterium]
MVFFHFKHFSINQEGASMKVGTDAMILGSLIPEGKYVNALDIGTGTGVLALMTVQKNPKISITAIDIDAANVSLANENFKNSLWNKNLTVKKENFFFFKTNQIFDLIFSNPPFYLTDLGSSSSRKLSSKHLSSDFLDVFFEKSASMLSNNGVFWLILPYKDFDEWTLVARSHGLKICSLIYIYGKESNCNRIVVEFKKNTPKKVKESSLIIRDKKGGYSEEYKILTKEFHGVNL